MTIFSWENGKKMITTAAIVGIMLIVHQTLVAPLVSKWSKPTVKKS